MTHIDVKAFAVGGLNAGETREAETHLAGCEACREELAGVRATLGSLALLKEEDPPRRIAFVSDKVFEPRWWQRLNPTFASACVLASAIVFHAVSGTSEAEIQARIDRGVESRLQDVMVVLDQTDKRVTQIYKAAMDLRNY